MNILISMTAFLQNEHYFVKPNFNGSSYGISKVSDKKFNEALKEAKNTLLK